MNRMLTYDARMQLGMSGKQIKAVCQAVVEFF